MEIQHWENNDKWGPLRDIVNELVDAVNLSMPPIGSVIAMPSETAPNARWVFCEGQELSRTTYSELFAMYGTTFGSGDGSTTFNIPDISDRTIFGKGNDVGDIGDVGGEAEVLLTSEQSGLRDHKHEVGGYAEGGGAIANIMKTSGASYGLNTGGSIDADGESSRDGAQDALEAHNNLPPYVVMNWFVRVL